MDAITDDSKEPQPQPRNQKLIQLVMVEFQENYILYGETDEILKLEFEV